MNIIHPGEALCHILVKTQDLPLAAAAQALAEAGLAVFPCRPLGKEPATGHGYKDATTDLEKIKAWWGADPRLNLGLPCAPNRLVVLDEDPRNGARLEDLPGPIPETLVVETPNGGRHYYFSLTDGLSPVTKLAPGWDVKYNGYVLVPPSTVGGRRYQVVVPKPIAPAPDWLLARAKAPGATAAPVEQRLVEGERNNGLFRLAASLRAKGLSQEAILAALQAENQSRCAPPLPDAEVDRIAKSAGRYPPGDPGPVASPAPKGRQDEVFLGAIPAQAFPWERFPMAEAFLELAQATSSNPDAIPGAVFAILGAALGRSLVVSPKPGWQEPLIFWAAEIASSGAGKSPRNRLLVEPLLAIQDEEHNSYSQRYSEYEEALKKWNSLPAKQRGERPREPEPMHVFLVTDATREALAAALSKHPTGGILAFFDEVSRLISSQNEYKSGAGADREYWLTLYDGSPLVIARAKNSIYIPRSCISILGGVQPATLYHVFGRTRGGLYVSDGTIYRLIFAITPRQYRPLTRQAWSEAHRQAWQNMVINACRWGQQRAKDPMQLLLSEDGWQYLSDWHTAVMTAVEDMDDSLYAYASKLLGIVLRVAGVLHFMRHHPGETIPRFISRDTVALACDIGGFYLATFNAMLHILRTGCSPEQLPESDAFPRLLLAWLNQQPGTSVETYVGKLLAELQKMAAPGESPFLPPAPKAVMAWLLKWREYLKQQGVTYQRLQRDNKGVPILFSKNATFATPATFSSINNNIDGVAANAVATLATPGGQSEESYMDFEIDPDSGAMLPVAASKSP